MLKEGTLCTSIIGNFSEIRIEQDKVFEDNKNAYPLYRQEFFVKIILFTYLFAKDMYVNHMGQSYIKDSKCPWWSGKKLKEMSQKRLQQINTENFLILREREREREREIKKCPNLLRIYVNPNCANK